jgi:hypothetical protein
MEFLSYCLKFAHFVLHNFPLLWRPGLDFYAKHEISYMTGNVYVIIKIHCRFDKVRQHFYCPFGILVCDCSPNTNTCTLAKSRPSAVSWHVTCTYVSRIHPPFNGFTRGRCLSLSLSGSAAVFARVIFRARQLPFE